MNLPLLYVTTVTETKSFKAMFISYVSRLSPAVMALEENRRRPAKRTIFLQLVIGERLRSRIIPATARGTEVSTTARQTAR